MKKLSYWAKKNIAKARILIVLSEVLLFALAVSLGILLMRTGIYVPLLVALLSLLLLVGAIIMYPSNGTRKKLRSKLYFRQKSCDVSIALSVFILVCFMVNREKIIGWNLYTPLQGTYMSLKETKDAPVKKTISKKQARKELRVFRNQLRKNNSGLTGLYIALIILGSVGLFLLVGSLACGISCSGNDGLAILVFLLGTFGIVFLAVKLIRQITRRRKKAIEKNNTMVIPFAPSIM